MIETNARHYDDRAFMLYAVSTYVPGKTLRELPAGSYGPESAIKWVVARETLQACREAGIRHRDVKPENCILSNDRKLYLVDFGLPPHGGGVHATGDRHDHRPLAARRLRHP